jgi:hypothetical protein
VSRTNDRQGDSQPQSPSDNVCMEERIARLRAALDGLDLGRALHIVASSIVGDHLDRELVIMNPDTGRVFAYLIPPGHRHALHAAARHAERGDAAQEPALTLDQALERFGHCVNPVSAAIDEP